MAAPFPFNDLHGFKDYVHFVQVCSATRFPHRDNRAPEDQWTVDLAFEGLRLGLSMAAKEKGDLPVFAECLPLVDAAQEAYRAGDRRRGYFTLEEVIKRLDPIPTD